MRNIMVLALALLAAGNAVAATIAECLKPWELRWMLPVYPRYALAECRKADAPGGRYLAGPVRKTLVELRSDFRWMLPSRYDTAMYDQYERGAQDAALAHFELLFAENGLRRVGLRTSDDGTRDVPTGAIFEGRVHGERIRILVGVEKGKTQMTLEQPSDLLPGVSLPRPERAHSLLEPGPGPYGALFALPGAKLTRETVQGGKTIYDIEPARDGLSVPVPPIDPKTFIVPAFSSRDERGVYWVLARRFEYEYPKDIALAELFGAYRAALAAAGWQVREHPHFHISDAGAFGLDARFDLPDRRLYMKLNVSAVAQPVVYAELFDPTYEGQILPVEREMREHPGFYTFTPTLDRSGAPTPATQRQVEVLGFHFDQALHTTQPPPKFGLLFRRAVSAKAADAAAAEAQAARSVQWLMGEFKRRGWREDRFLLDEKTLVIDADRPEFRGGVRVEVYTCYPNAPNLAANDAALRCICRAERRILSEDRGACS